MTHVITVPLDLPEGKTIRQCDNRVVGDAMDPELDRFQQWLMSQGNDPLVRSEKAMLKTYLAYKLIYENADDDGQD